MPIKQPPWIREDDLDYWTNEFKQFRVLVCGRAGVGKSTLINRVFGIDMTTVSHQAHGIHDIDQGFETDTRPGIIIHDSRGFALGSVKEVEMFSSFIKKRCSPKASSEDQLHAVWLCIEIGSNRMIHAAEEHLFQILRDHAAGVPVVVIGTQTDKYRHEHFNKIRERLQSTSTYEDTRAGATLLSLDNRVKQEYKVNFEERKQQFENQILTMNKSTSRVPLFAYVSHDDPASITTLLKITREHTLDIGAAKGLMAAQTINVELKIEEAIDSTVFLLRCAVNIAAVGTVVPLGLVNLTSTPTLSWMLCKNIVACFGIASSSSTKTTITPTRKATRSTTFGFGKEKNGIGKQRNGPLEKTTEESTTLITIDEIEKITRKILTGNLRAFMLQEVAQNIALWGGMATLTLFTVFGGVPLFIGASLMEAAPAAQMVVKCACDLILILDKAYHDGNGTVTKAGIEEVVEWYCRGGDGKDRAGARGENGTGKSEKMRSPQPDLMTTTTTTKKDARTKARSLQSRVHREIAGLIPIASVKFWKGFQISRIRIGMEDIVARNRVVLPLVEESGQIHSCGRNLNASRDQTDSLRRLLPDVDADEGDESTLSWASMHSSDDDDDTEKDELL
ncbi:hypothetical protein MMC25_000589 [Agyrium rufum]|nr:hypothetical protein [Agyrium rufum]